MKFHKLTIENIASLKGKHTIEFSELYAVSSLFAITGDTGSGKSTLLNAISLSLYGQNYKKSLNQIDFITLSEPYGATELEFSLDNKFYKFNWSCRVRKKNGEALKTPKLKREFFIKTQDDDWSILEESSDELLQLTFEQFCKTIILNQGDFARFLTSSFKERKDILEKFYDGYKLDSLSITNRRLLNQTKEQISLNESKISGFDQSNVENLNKNELKEEIYQLENIISASHNSLSESKNNLKNLEDILKTQEIIKTSLKRKTKISEENSKLTDQLNSQKTKNNSLKIDLKAVEKNFNLKQPLLLEAIKTKQQIDSNDQDLRRTLKEIAHVEKGLTQNKKDLFNTKSEIKTLSNKISLEQVEIDPDADTEKAALLLSNLQSLTSQKEIEALKQQNTKENLLSIEQQAQLKKNKKEEYLSKINSYPSIEALNEDILSEQEKLDRLNEEQKSYKTILIDEENINKEIEKLDAEEKLIIKSKKELTLEQKINLDQLELQNDRIKLGQLESALELCRKHSEEKSQCIVCGNPDIKSLLNNRDSQTHSKLDEALKKVKELNAKNIEIIKKLEQNQAQEGYHTKLKNDFKKKKLDIETLKGSQHHFPELEKRIKKTKDSIEKRRKTLGDIALYQNSTKQIEEELKELRRKYSITKEEFDIASSKVVRTSEEIINAKESLIDLTKVSLSFSEYSTQLEELKNYKHSKKIKEEKLKYIKQLEQIKTKSEKNLEEKEEYCSGLIESKNDLLIKFDKLSENKSPEEQLQKLKNNITHKQEAYDLSSKILTELKVKKSDIDSRLKSTQEQIDSSIDLINTLLSNFTSLEKQNAELSKINDELQQLKLYDKIDFNVLTEIFENYQNFIKQAQEENSQNKMLLTKKTTQLKQLKSIEKEVGKLKSESKEYYKKKISLENLYELIGRDEFRNFVLSNIENNLIIQTNIELKQLCDERYEIVQYRKSIKNPPEFYVIDKYKAGLQRKVSTLSGGETFMVSLAMALALSELTRGTRQIDSLFIDEGFGTLDSDSLEEVIEMLLNMSLRGKSIGLITHVQKLSERIPVNINLNKSEQGVSKIKIKYN